MFGRKNPVLEILLEIKELTQAKNEKIDEIEKLYQDLEINLDKKIIAFTTEFTDRYFDTFGSFLKLISNLSMKEPDFSRLKKMMMEPIVKEDWDKKHAEEAERINRALESKGERIRQARERYKEDKIRLEREEKDTKFVDAKLEVLDKLVEGIE